MGETRLLLPERALGVLRCPMCRAHLVLNGPDCVCVRVDCRARYLVVRGVPALLPPGAPLLAFRNDYDNRPTAWRRARRLVRANLPNIVLNVGGRKAISRLLQLLFAQTAAPVILNIGEKHPGPVLQALITLDAATVIHADCALGSETNLVADCRSLPLEDASVDAVVIDSGLEHVPEPREAVREIHRVLKNSGLVYVDLPFMMPVHAGASDFQRFTSAGLRALFRDFEEIERGVSCGPAMALSQMTQYCMLSFVRRQWARVTVKLVCRFALFWLKYLDVFLVQRPGAMDAAGGTYFIGRKTDRSVTNEEIARGYRGIVPSMYEPLKPSKPPEDEA